MKAEIITLLGYKLVLFTGLIFSFDSTCLMLAQINPSVGTDVYKIISNFGVIGGLVLAIRYFIAESRRVQKEFSVEKSDQEERHSRDRITMLEFHNKQIEILTLKIDKLQEKHLEACVKLATLEKDG